MIYTHEEGSRYPNFIFVHINRTAGSSIEFQLNRQIPTIFLSEFESEVGYDRAQHYNVLEYRQILGCRYEDYFSFSVIRNPWDRMLSCFKFYYRKSQETEIYEQFNRWLDKRFDFNGLRYDFKTLMRPNHFKDMRLFEPCVDWLNGGVDFIARFETLDNDWRVIASKLNLEKPNKLLPVKNESRHRHRDYRKYYMSKSVELIEIAFKRDIEICGYSFDDFEFKK